MSGHSGGVAYEVDDGVPATIRIVPSEPVPETSADGVPTAMLYVSGATGLLNMGARWWPSESELTAIRQRLATAMGRTPADFVVTPDAFRVTAVSLLLSDGADGAPIELARSTSSGVPPFTALFSADVSHHLDAVQRACLGEPRLLYVQVEAELTRGRSATTTLAADVGEWADELLGEDADELAAQIDALVEQGAIHRTRSASPDADPAGDELAAQADRMAAERFAAAVRDTGPPVAGGTTRVGVAATAHRPERTPLARRADVGGWLRSSPGRHVLVAPAGGSDRAGPAGPTAPARPVGVGFAAAGAPVANVELSGGGEPVTLVPPFGADITVPADDELEVTTHYTGGGAPYRVRLPRDGEGWVLSPADLGLAEVSIDATRLHDAGATAVQADVFYQPEDRGSPDRRTVRFDGTTWQARWFVVTRGQELAGRLLLKLAVTPDGVGGLRPSLQSTTATVRL